jgi:hypothetical protein
MTRLSNDERTAAVAALVGRENIECDGVSIAGAAGEVAVVRVRTVDADRLAALSKRIKALGFRYVTIDLDAVESAS